MSSTILHVAWSWEETKYFIEHSIAFSSDALHVITGVLLQQLFAAILRRPVSSFWPWLPVLALTLANEAADLWFDQWPHPGMQYGEGARDVLLTMFLPTVLMLSVRWLPRSYGAPR